MFSKISEKEKKEHNFLPVVEGDCRVSNEPETIFSTVLGSCIAVCLFDPVQNVGGMNHFLLPGSHSSPSGDTKYGIFAMELLLQRLLEIGAQRQNLRAKMFGGSKLIKAGANIGEENQRFARAFLRREGIKCVASHVGGAYARKIRFEPVGGRVRHMLVPLEQVAEQTKITLSMK